MAKTYTAAGTVAAGDVATAAAWNVVTADVNNLIVPPAVQVVRTSDLTSYTSNSNITWQSITSGFDTDGMWSAGAPTVLTVNTAGMYLIVATLAYSGAATIALAGGNIVVNGTSIVQQYSPPLTNSGYLSISAVVNLAATNTISAQLGFSGGSAYVVKGSATFNDLQSRLTATWIGRLS
jgi:hypothetical protein